MARLDDVVESLSVATAEGPSEIEMVRAYLRAQNMEQLGHVDEAIELYESAVAGHFDSTGPYERLIALYSNQALHKDVARVAEAALNYVRTYEDKRAWYRQMQEAALKAASSVPKATPKRK